MCVEPPAGSASTVSLQRASAPSAEGVHAAGDVVVDRGVDRVAAGGDLVDRAVGIGRVQQRDGGGAGRRWPERCVR